MNESTFVLLKPDAIKRRLLGEIIKRYELCGLNIVDARFVSPSEIMVKKHYEEHQDKPFFESLKNYIMSGPVVAMILEGPDAIKKTREINGATDPTHAKEGTIRGDLAKTIDENLVHASDSYLSYEREFNIWFS